MYNIIIKGRKNSGLALGENSKRVLKTTPT
jgi:hypothetical protein